MTDTPASPLVPTSEEDRIRLSRLLVPMKQEDDEDDVLPPEPRQDTKVQRVRRIKRICEEISNGTPVNRAVKIHGTTPQSFWRWCKQSPAVKKLYKRASDALTNKLKDTAITCGLKAVDDPRYLRALEFTIKLRDGIFDKKERQVIIQQAEPEHRKVEFIDIPASDREPPPSSEDIEEEIEEEETLEEDRSDDPQQ